MIPFLRPSKYPRKLVNTCLEKIPNTNGPYEKLLMWVNNARKHPPVITILCPMFTALLRGRAWLPPKHVRAIGLIFTIPSHGWFMALFKTPGWLPNEYILGGSWHFETIQPWLKQLLASPRSALSILSLCNTWVYPNKHQ